MEATFEYKIPVKRATYSHKQGGTSSIINWHMIDETELLFNVRNQILQSAKNDMHFIGYTNDTAYVNLYLIGSKELALNAGLIKQLDASTIADLQSMSRKQLRQLKAFSYCIDKTYRLEFIRNDANETMLKEHNCHKTHKLTAFGSNLYIVNSAFDKFRQK
jgi:hypothetical protein